MKVQVVALTTAMAFVLLSGACTLKSDSANPTGAGGAPLLGGMVAAAGLQHRGTRRQRRGLCRKQLCCRRELGRSGWRLVLECNALWRQRGWLLDGHVVMSQAFWPA